MRLGFFFVAAKCLCSSVTHFVEACGASATIRNETLSAHSADHRMPKRAVLAKAHCVRKAAAAIRPTIHRQAALPIQQLEATAACRRSPHSGSLPVPFPQELQDSARRICPKDRCPQHHSERPRKKLSPAGHTDPKKTAGVKDRAKSCRPQDTLI
jgi:hypothetical protein